MILIIRLCLVNKNAYPPPKKDAAGHLLGPIPSVLRGFPDAHPATKIGNEDQFIGIARPALRWMGPGLARRGRLPFAAAFGGAEKLQALIIIGGYCAAIAACPPRPPQR